MAEPEDNLALSRQNALGAGLLDRCGHLRREGELLPSLLAGEATALVPVWRGKNLFAQTESPEPVFLTPARAKLTRGERGELVFMGTVAGTHYLAALLDSKNEAIPRRYAKYGVFSDLRRFLSTLGSAQGELLATARGYAHWRQTSRFCGVCGKRLTASEGGHTLTCGAGGCGNLVFPRTDPAVIVLVTRGDKCLLGRQASWPVGRFSSLAGFVEPGESLEEAVVREVREEAGIAVDRVSYRSSQPWPFPSSLMAGFHARAASSKISLHDKELIEARWFTRAQLAKEIRAGTLLLPTSASISFRLLEEWYDAGPGGKLADLAGC